jgi:hypothetical protein
VPKHIADTSPTTTPADRFDRVDRARRDPDGPAAAGVEIASPTARTVVIRPLLVAS